MRTIGHVALSNIIFAIFYIQWQWLLRCTLQPRRIFDHIPYTLTPSGQLALNTHHHLTHFTSNLSAIVAFPKTDQELVTSADERLTSKTQSSRARRRE
jgi:hypothetical protein